MISLNSLRGSVRRIARISGIDALVVGTTAMYTVPTGRTLVVTGVVPRVTVGTAVTVDGSVSLGTSGSFDQIVPTAVTNQMRAVNDEYALPVSAKAVIVPAGGTVTFRRVTGGTGTTLTIDVDLLGYEY